MENTNIPQTIGKYKVQGIIAKGGMGVVYKAIHPSLKRYVVIKKMTARKNSTNAERFKKEAQILLDLQSPYIVHLFDYFTEGGYRYMVEELVDGLALDKLIQKQICLPPPVAMLILQDACFALKYAHSKKIVHRDIKPGNILISKRGEIKLADFGIASDSEPDENITKEGSTVGTPAYMPPEQFENSANVDNRADIYALGIMLYEMLTGSKPYPGTFSIETLKVIKKGRYIHPRKIDKTIPRELEHLIHKMIRPNRKRRFKSVDGVLHAIKKYLKHYDTHELRVQVAKSVIATGTYDFPPIITKDRKRRIARRIIAGTILFLILIGVLFKGGFFHRTILRGKYTPVKIELEIPKSQIDEMDLPIKAFFFVNDGDEIPEVENSRCTFDLKGTKRLENILNLSSVITVERLNSKNHTYDTPTVFLKKGEYRAKIVVGPYVIWKSFAVADEAVVLKCNQLVNAQTEMQLQVTVNDAKTGKDITKLSDVYINYKNKWQPIDDIPREDLKSGKVWKIRVEAEGFETEEFSLLIDWYQNVLYISAALNPDNANKALKKDFNQ